MADNIGTVVQGAHSGFYVYWAKHLGIDKEAFYLSERKNTASVSLSDICLDTSTVVGYEEIGSRTGPNFNAVAKSTLLVEPPWDFWPHRYRTSKKQPL